MARLKSVTVSAPLTPLPGALDEWRSGTGKIIRVGDVIYVDGHPSIDYKVKGIRETSAGVEVTAFGGPAGHGKFRTFLAGSVHRRLDPLVRPA